jgi:hypothetical protein
MTSIPISEKRNRYHGRESEKYVMGCGGDYTKQFMERWGANGKIGKCRYSATD